MQTGLEKGYEKERQERLVSLRQKLLTLVHVRYPGLESLARVQIVEHDDPEMLEEVLLKIALAQDAQEAKQHLLSSDHQDV